MEQQTGFKGKEVRQDCILSPCLLTYMQSTSCEMPGWMKHKLDQDCRENDTTLMAESEEELKRLLMKVKAESGKS